MSFPTKPTFVVAPTGWSEDMLVHPMMRFLHKHELVFDAKDWEADKKYYASDFVYVKPTGQTFKGAEAVDALQGDYALFSEHYHEPLYGQVAPTDDGFTLFGYAKMYVNLPVPGEKSATDLKGRKWDAVAHGAFRFNVRKSGDGPDDFLFTFSQVYADPTPILAVAIKRGVIPVEALLA